MGCSICLESYEDDADKGRRPVALPCGHIFHRACSDGWLKSCRMRNDPACCPLCKQQLGTARSLPLWPGDVNDLDTYIAHRNRRVEYQKEHQDRRPTPATVFLDRHMDRDLQGQLLGKLMDFRQHINAYLMAVNNVSMSSYGGEDRIFRLFMDLSKGDKDKQEEFESCLHSLSIATNVLNETIGTSEEMHKDTERKNRLISEKYEKIREMEQSLERHHRIKTEEEQRMHKEQSRLKTLQLHAKKELQDLERKKEKMERERQAYINEAREKATEALKARLESAQLIAQSKGDAQSEVEKMKIYVLEQERLRIEAENAAREAKSKSSFLADRNKQLFDKLTNTRRELKRVTNSGGGGKKQEASRGIKREEEEETFELDKGKAPESLQWDDDGFVELGYRPAKNTSHSLNTFGEGTSRFSINRHSSEQRTPNDSAIVVIDDELDAELDDSTYFMPGIDQSKSSSSSSRHRRRRSSPDVEGDESIEYVGEKRRRHAPDSELLQSIMSGHLVLGPRQRAR